MDAGQANGMVQSRKKAAASSPPWQLEIKYAELMAIMEDLGKDIRPSNAGNKASAERLKRSIIHAQILTRECIVEVEKAADLNPRSTR